jgi:uncharacterized protein with HEPN domain
MVRAAANALTFTKGMAEEDFLVDLRTQRAVVMSLMIVGEAASRIVSDRADFADSKAAIPWRGMLGMRNRIAHGYFDIDEHIVWTTVQTELPALIKHLSQPYSSHSSQSSGSHEHCPDIGSTMHMAAVNPEACKTRFRALAHLPRLWRIGSSFCALSVAVDLDDAAVDHGPPTLTPPSTST